MTKEEKAGIARRNKAVKLEREKLVRSARKHCKSPEDAEDAVQAALLRFWEQGSAWRESKLMNECRSNARNTFRSNEARRRREGAWMHQQVMNAPDSTEE